MSYKTILVHADSSSHAQQRIQVAARIAQAENAHLVGAAMTGITRFIYQDTGMDLTRSVLAEHMGGLRQQADRSLAAFEAIVDRASLRSFERRVVDDDPGAALALQAHYADLVVLSQVDRSEPISRQVPDLPEYVVLNGARPVLVVPYAGNFEQLGSHALIAWDASAEATRAVGNALPLLRRAGKVTVAVFNATSAHGEQPGADIALYLARHGVQVEVAEQKTSIDIGNALLSLAADVQADLLVMGCYGHTRFRELLLGGVTSTVLKSMTVPVLMSH